MKALLVLPFILVATPNYANAKKKNPNSCKTLNGCTKVASRLLGHKYFYASDLKGKVFSTSPLTLTKDNANVLISELLNQNGYTRVNVYGDTYKIISARDIRYTPTKSISYTAGNLESIPDLSDYLMVTFKLKNPASARDISRSFRPFMSRYGRIIEINSNGSLIIQDTGKNIRRLAGLIQELDRPLTSEQKEALEEAENRRFELKKIRATACENDGHKGGRSRRK